MIYDCFLFFNELDLLEIRLNMLNDVVDKFVLAESVETFSGNKKDLVFLNNISRFEKFKDKIIYIKIEKYSTGDAWKRESFQRDALDQGLQNITENDFIMISDLDEIPDPKIIKDIKDNKIKNIQNHVFGFRQQFYYYYLNYKFVDLLWKRGTKLVSAALYKKMKMNPQYIRSFHKDKNTIFLNGGWHFSYLGGIDKIIYKIKSFSHQEYNNSKYTDKDHLLNAIKNGKDLFNRNYKFIKTDLTNLPDYIKQNKDRYKNLILI